MSDYPNAECMKLTVDETPSSEEVNTKTILRYWKSTALLLAIYSLALTTYIAVGGVSKTIPSSSFASAAAAVSSVPASPSLLGLPEDRNLSPGYLSPGCDHDYYAECERTIRKYEDKCYVGPCYETYGFISDCMRDFVNQVHGNNCLDTSGAQDVHIDTSDPSLENLMDTCERPRDDHDRDEEECAFWTQEIGKKCIAPLTGWRLMTLEQCGAYCDLEDRVADFSWWVSTLNLPEAAESGAEADARRSKNRGGK